jgi:hypothetical protein
MGDRDIYPRGDSHEQGYRTPPCRQRKKKVLRTLRPSAGRPKSNSGLLADSLLSVGTFWREKLQLKYPALFSLALGGLPGGVVARLPCTSRPCLHCHAIVTGSLVPFVAFSTFTKLVLRRLRFFPDSFSSQVPSRS